MSIQVINAFALGASAPATDPYFANVVLLAGFDTFSGPGGTTPDESSYARTINLPSSSYIGAVPRYGPNALVLAAGFRAEAADSADFHLASGSWTIECSARFTALPTGTSAHLIGQFLSSSNQRSWAITYNAASSVLTLSLSTAGSATITKISASFTPTLNTYYDLAADFDGTTYRLYINGAMVGSATTLVALHNSTAAFSVGAQPDLSFPLNGYIDEVRITKGVARYASGSGYTPSGAAFPRS